MSVLNQSGEEQVECPLCMEPLEVDDLHFYPCTCGYQICRFCWHRIRTDENGLCPACRKAYSENPADFIPLSKEQVAQLKAEKRQRDQQRKAKLTENRKHLASVRVVQRNLVFVVGLPMRLADPEVLKKYEYFGKFGKIHKVVINQSTSYAGTQGPSASAYVTYMKSDDALRAIQNVNNTIMDGKTIKTSLGTTKYCSHFMKNQSCPKPDCMYLHDFGDQEASFTKEQMHAGKHQDYEKKLHEVLLSKLAAQTTAPTPTPPTTTSTTTITNGGANGGGEPKKSSTKESVISSSSTTSTNSTVSTSSAADKNKDNWPLLNQNETKTEKKPDKAEKDKKKNKAKSAPKLEKKSPPPPEPKPEEKPTEEEPPQPEVTPPVTISPSEPPQQQPQQSHPPIPPIHKLNPHQIVDDNTSFFSQNTFSKLPDDSNPLDTSAHQLNHHHIPMPQSDGLLDINDTDSWDFDFGYEKHSSHLEELAKQRITVNDMLETFTGLEQYPKIDNPTPSYPTMVDNYDTENLLETLAKNSVNYQNTVHNPTPPPQQSGHYMNGHKELNNLDQHMSKFFSDFYRNGYKQQLSPNLHNIPLRDNIHPLNGYHQFPQQQQQQQLSQQHQLDRIEKNRMVLLQQRLQIEEQLLNLGLDRNKHSFGQLNGHYDPMQNGGSGNFGNYLGGQLSSAGGGGNTMNAGKNRSLLEDKDLDYRFQEAQKALEELVESDSHMHNTGRSRGGGSAIGMGSTNQQQQGQLNGLVHSQSGGHLPPPPPGFVQPTTTHMNSFGECGRLTAAGSAAAAAFLGGVQGLTFNTSPPPSGSKILPYLNMNSQQQLNNTQQNSWPTNFTQQQQQQNQQHKGMDWKVLDPAILSSRRHIPNMPPLLDQYGSGNSNGLQQQLQQQNQQMSNNGSSAVGSNMRSPFDSYNNSFYHHPIQSYGNYAHLSSPTAASAAVQNLNWLEGARAPPQPPPIREH